MLNGLLDRTAPEVLRAMITDREVRGNERRATHTLAFVTPVPGAERRRLVVGRRFYYGSWSHTHVCFYRFPGALGVSWCRLILPPGDANVGLWRRRLFYLG